MSKFRMLAIISVISCMMFCFTHEAGAVGVYSQGDTYGTGYFYIFNNTPASITLSGNYSQAGLPAIINPLSVSASSNLLDLTGAIPTLVYTLAPQSGGSSSFQITAYANEEDTYWNLESGTDSSWNTDGNTQSVTGATSINTCTCNTGNFGSCDCDEVCFIQQIWNSNYVVTLSSNLNISTPVPDCDYIWGCSPIMIVLFINPNTPDIVYQSPISNIGGNLDSSTWSMYCNGF